MQMKQTECSETSAFKIQTPGNRPKERIQLPEHGESLKSRMGNLYPKKELQNVDLETTEVVN